MPRPAGRRTSGVNQNLFSSPGLFQVLHGTKIFLHDDSETFTNPNSLEGEAWLCCNMDEGDTHMAKTTRKTEAFIVIDKGLRILITPSDGWYAVQGLDVRGLNTQGKTIEEAIYMAHDAAKALTEARALMAKKTAKEVKTEKAAASRPKRNPGRRQTVGTK